MVRNVNHLTTPEVRAKAKATADARRLAKFEASTFEEMKGKKTRIAWLLRDQKGICALCPQDQMWNDKPLVFHLDHVDGDNANNVRPNLRMICPNCHSQTDTYCGRNKKSFRMK